MNFCDYKTSLGEPGKGPHADRLFGLAIRDVIGTIFLGLAVALLSGMIFKSAMKLNMSVMNTGIYWSILIFFWIIVAFLFGILMHWMFCVETTLNKMLGLVGDQV